MTLHHDTDIYKTASELFDVVDTIVLNMKKQYNRRLGDRLLDANIDIVLLIMDVNIETSPRKRVAYLSKLARRVEKMELIRRLISDKRLASHTHVAEALRLLTSVGKQANGWKKYELKRLNAPAS